MASRLFKQFLFSLNPMLTYIEGSFVVGATGAVGSVKGGGISNVVRLTTGVYQIVLEDQYNRLLGFGYDFGTTVTGSALTSVTSGTVYVINALGTATAAQWQAVGLSANVTAAVGVVFKATASQAIGGSASVKVQAPSTISEVEVLGDPNTTIINQTPYIVVQTLGPVISSVATSVFTYDVGTPANSTVATSVVNTTTMTPIDPAQNSTFRFALMLRNSNLAGKGE